MIINFISNYFYQICFVAFFAVFLIGCKTEKDIVLIEPIDEVVHPSDLIFVWEGNENPVLFQLFSNDNTLLFDSIVSSQTLVLPEALSYSMDCNWQVSIGENIASANFKTTNVLDWFTGLHEVTAQYYCWGIGNYCDTTFQTTLDLRRDNEEMIVTVQGSWADTLWLNEVGTQMAAAGVFHYWVGGNQPNTINELLLNTNNGFINYKNELSGLGGGDRRIYTGFKD